MAVVYKRGQDTKARILEAAFEAFAQYGFHGSSMREIAAACGISHPGIRHHFDSKDDLLVAVLRQRDHKIYAHAADRIDREGFSIAAMTGIVKDAVENPRLSALFLSVSAQASDTEHPAHEYFVQRYSQMRAMFTEYIVELKKVGAVHESIVPEEAAVLVIGLMDGVQLQALLASEPLDIDKLLDDGIRSITSAIYLDEIPVPTIREFGIPVIDIHANKANAKADKP